MYTDNIYKEKIKVDLYPTSWCPGCGIGMLMIQVAKVLADLHLDYTNTAIISGVGCTGRMAGYMNFDGVYTLHGRTLPVAEAVKLVNPDLNVIVVSGDGDLASIGGNHLLHAIRRNPNVTVICNNNEVYGLTGGQAGPTTPKGTTTISSPKGTIYDPVNLQGLVKTNPVHFYAKTTIYHQPHIQQCIKEAIQWPGFAFVDVTTQCIENNGRRLGYKDAYDMLVHFRKTYRKAKDDAETLDPYQIGILKSPRE